MTDKLRQAAEIVLKALEEYTDVVATAHDADNWHQIIDGGKPAREAIQALRQAIEQAEQPQAMTASELAARIKRGEKWKIAEPDMGIDRGAWADVSDATKWVDELRGDEDLDEPEPFGWLFKQADGNLYKLLRGEDVEWSENHNPHWIKVSPLYTAPPKPDLLTQTCCECGRSGGYALYCGECWGKATKREWQGLTDEEIEHIWGITKPDYEDKFDFPRAIEAALKSKNGF